MKIRFDSTIEDVVDVNFRTLTRSKVVRNWRLVGAGGSGIIFSALIFAFLPESKSARVTVAIIGFFVMSIGYWFLYPDTVKNRLRKFYRERLGGDGPFSVEVELSDKGILVTSCGQEIRFNWHNIVEIVDSPFDIQFNERYGGVIVIRKRGLPGDEVFQFLNEARKYHGSREANVAAQEARI